MPTTAKTEPTLYRLTLLFLKLGLTAFGGPAAHIAMMEDEVVRKRRWIDRQRFLDMVGATNLIPGPNSTEMCIHVGHVLRSWPGLLLCGVSFILPAAALTLGLAWIYVHYGTVPDAAHLLRGIKPAIMVVILDALLRLGKKAVKSIDLGVLGAGVMVLALFGFNQVLLILAAGAVGMLWIRQRARLWSVGGLWWGFLAGTATASTVRLQPGLTEIGLYFLKIGSVLFGSGYVLIAYLEEGLVRDHGWITQAQLLDAIAIGQFTPGPVLTTATFIGFLLAGVPGAAVATVGIFLPSFLFVAMLRPLVPKLRDNPWTAAFLDSVNVAAVALMAAVLVQLSRTALTAWPDFTVLALAVLLQMRLKIRVYWVVLLCGLASWLISRASFGY